VQSLVKSQVKGLMSLGGRFPPLSSGPSGVLRYPLQRGDTPRNAPNGSGRTRDKKGH